MYPTVAPPSKHSVLFSPSSHLAYLLFASTVIEANNAFSFVLFCTEVSLIQYAEKSIVHTEQMRISFVSYIKVIEFRGKYLHFMLR